MLQDEEGLARRRQARTLGEPRPDRVQFVASQWLRRRPHLLEPGYVQHPALDIDLMQPQPAGLRHPQAVAENHEDEAAVAQLGAAAASPDP